MKKIAFLLMVLLGAACGSVKVSYDYDKTVDFYKYKTYAYAESAMKLPIGDLNRDRIIASIDAEMAARGITKSESPDALIDVILTAKERTEATATNTGGYYGRYGYAGGYGGTTSINYNTYVDGTLIINVVDKTSEKIVWQGRGTKTIDEDATPEKRESNIKYAVKTIYANYPVKPIKK
jgi:hypothetical protein